VGIARAEENQGFRGLDRRIFTKVQVGEDDTVGHFLEICGCAGRMDNVLACEARLAAKDGDEDQKDKITAATKLCCSRARAILQEMLTPRQ